MPSIPCPPGQQVEVGLGVKLVRIFHRGQLVEVHPRQSRDRRSTDPTDYPAELSAYTLRAPDGIKRSAAELGPAVAEFAEHLFDGHLPWSRIRQGHKLIRLGERYTPQRLEAACRKALEVDSSTWDGWSAFWSKLWNYRRPRSIRRRCPLAVSLAQAMSSPMLKATPIGSK
jgi:hypothetical protein